MTTQPQNESIQSPVAALPDEYRPLKGGMLARLGPVGFVLQRAGVQIGVRYGGSFHFQSQDRVVLENLILPYYQISPSHNSILLVGTEWYTHGYVRMFVHKSLATLDINPDKAKFGAKRHIVDSIANLERHFGAAEVDFIALNGVIGWGLNEIGEAAKAIAACHKCLRPGGHLLIGFNDLPENRPFKLSEIPSLAKFQPVVFPPLGTHEYLVDNGWRHVYCFYQA